jgi:hypothetical protein
MKIHSPVSESLHVDRQQVHFLQRFVGEAPKPTLITVRCGDGRAEVPGVVRTKVWKCVDPDLCCPPQWVALCRNTTTLARWLPQRDITVSCSAGRHILYLYGIHSLVVCPCDVWSWNSVRISCFSQVPSVHFSSLHSNAKQHFTLNRRTHTEMQPFCFRTRT